jgi:hypothetical protein
MNREPFDANSARIRRLLAAAAQIDLAGWRRVRDRFKANERAVHRAREEAAGVFFDMYPVSPIGSPVQVATRAAIAEQRPLIDAAVEKVPEERVSFEQNIKTFRSVAFIAWQALTSVHRTHPELESTPRGRRAAATIVALFEGVLPDDVLQPPPVSAEPGAEAPDDADEPKRIERVAPPRRRRRTPIRPATSAANEAALREIIKDIGRRWKDRASRERLSHAEQVIDALGRIVDGEIQNGGIDQFLINDSGDVAEFAVASLAEIGAADTEAILRRTLTIFPGGKVPADAEARRVHIVEHCEDGWDDALTRAYGASRDHMVAALVKYARAKLPAKGRPARAARKR